MLTFSSFTGVPGMAADVDATQVMMWMQSCML